MHFAFMVFVMLYLDCCVSKLDCHITIDKDENLRSNILNIKLC